MDLAVLSKFCGAVSVPSLEQKWRPNQHFRLNTEEKFQPWDFGHGKLHLMKSRWLYRRPSGLDFEVWTVPVSTEMKTKLGIVLKRQGHGRIFSSLSADELSQRTGESLCNRQAHVSY